MAKNGRPVDERNLHEQTDKRIRKDTRIGKSKEKYDDTDLPSPPPDPWSSSSCTQPGQSPTVEAPRGEEDIIAYLAGIRTPPCDSRNSDCLSRNSATSTMAVTSLYTEESFEQLDRLYDMAEQILELRDRSSKLFRRVRELEKLKVLRTADLRAERAIFANDEISSDLPDEDAGFAESLLDAIISSSRDTQLQRRNPRSSYTRQRSRSLAVSEQSLPRSPNLGNRSSLGIEKTTFRNEVSGSPKVSKWTRVKAAFKWERACPNDVTDSNVEQTPTTPTTPTTKYLRIPDISAGSWSGSALSPSTGEISAPSTPIGRPSSASSSNEDVFDRQRKNISDPGDRRISRAKEATKKNESIVCSPSLENDTTVVTTNDDAMQYASEVREINHSKPLIRITAESTPEPEIEPRDSKLLSNTNKYMEGTIKKMTPTLTITIPSNEEEFRIASSPESTSPLPSSTLDSGQNSPHRMKIRPSGQTFAEFKRQRSIAEESPAPKIQRVDSKWNKVRRAFLSNATFSVPPSPVRVIGRQSFLQDDPETSRARSCTGSVDDLTKNSSMSNNHLETRRDYQALREKLGAEFHQKLVEWERLKRSTGGNMRGTRDAFTSSNGTTPSSPHESLLLTEDRLDPEFKKKLQEWKRSKKGRRGSASIEPQRVSRRRLTDWQLWRSPSKPETKSQELMEPRRSCGSVGSTGSVGSDGKSHLCEDFVRRMETWRRLSEASRQSSSVRLGVNSDTVDETEFLALDRVLTIFGNLGQENNQNSDWLEQNSKFAEKSRNFKSGNEILIRTSVGSYRFEGISQEFTRKLYDWEKYRGISPRSSTFRLLGPAYAPFVRTADDSTTTAVSTTADEEEVFLGGIKRSKSVGSIVKASECTEPLIRRSASLRSLDYLTEKLEVTDLMADSPAPGDSERRPGTSEDTNMDDSEPEAMIIDIEDVIEETASPLRRIQPHQTPVYSVAASETTSIAVPLGTVTSSHEPSPAILMENKDDWDIEHWESRNWNLRNDPYHQDSSASGNWLSSWNTMADFSSCEKIGMEFEKYWRQRPDYSDQNTPDEETWKFQSWERTSKYSSKDEESTKSDRSLESIQNDGFSDDPEEDFNQENLRSEASNFRCGETNEDLNDILTPNDECIDETTMNFVSKSENFLTKIMEGLEDTTELPCENNEERTSERLELRQDKDENDISKKTDGKNEILAETNQIPNLFYHRQVVDVPAIDNVENILPSSTLPLQSESSFLRDKEIGVNIAEKENNVENTKIFQLNQYTNFPTIRFSHELLCSNISTNQYEDKKETANTEILKKEESKGKNVSVLEKIEDSQNPDQKEYHSFEKISKTSLQSGAMEFREPTIKTMPLTVSTNREARYIERIIINKETLKKIVVPTASSDNPTCSFSKKDEPASEDYCTLEGTCKDETSLERDSYVVNQNTNNGERAKERTESTSRNVFVKTKRMIFSPFRRSDDRRSPRETDIDELSLDRIERRQSKSISKSRSASPRVFKQDVLPRMPLFLPWSLRSSTKEAGTKDDKRVEEKSWFQKYHRRTRSREERSLQQNEMIVEGEGEKSNMEKVEGKIVESFSSKDENDKKIRCMKEKESLELKNKSKKVYRDPLDDGYEEIIVREIEQDNSFSAASSIVKEEENDVESSSISDTLPSDLVHKLRILSNAAAKRDGRISSCIDATTIESRSTRIQRAKEGFLSRRGGPLCQSMLESSTPITLCQDSIPFEENLRTLKTGDNIGEDQNWDIINDFSCPTPPVFVPQSPDLNKDSGSKSDLIKSASAGMINVDPDTFGRLATSNRGCESLPRTISKRRNSGGPLMRIVNKLRFSNLIRAKENGDRNMSTISTLCRQSLLIDVRPDLEENHESEDPSDDEENRKKQW